VTGRVETYRRARLGRANSQVACRLPLAGGPPARPGAECAISCAIIALLREHTSRSPTDARTVFSADRAIVMLRDGLTSEELYLARRGHAALVMRTRAALYDAVRDEATAAVEAIMQRRVTACLTDQDHEPDLAVMAFVFQPALELIAA
jgi:uncharacterized protein YbcI